MTKHYKKHKPDICIVTPDVYDINVSCDEHGAIAVNIYGVSWVLQVDGLGTKVRIINNDQDEVIGAN